MVPGQKANSDNLGIFSLDFLHNNCMMSEAILSTHNIQFCLIKYEKKIPKYLFS